MIRPRGRTWIRRGAVVLLLCSAVAAGCVQQLDSTAASGKRPSPPAGGHTEATNTPPIETDSNDPPTTTTSACTLTTQQATTVLADTCANCHGGRNADERRGLPPFDYVLDFTRLKTARSQTVKDPTDMSVGMRFVIPDDPDRSRLYLLVAVGEMPPAGALPRPTTSDVSVLRAWITSCLGPPELGDAGPPSEGTDGGNDGRNDGRND